MKPLNIAAGAVVSVVVIAAGILLALWVLFALNRHGINLLYP